MNDLLHEVLVFLLKALGFGGVLAGGWLAATALRRLAGPLLVRAGLDRAVPARLPAAASDIAAKLVFYATMFLALHLAFRIWGGNPVSALLDSVIGWLPRVFVAIVIVVVAAAIARAAKDIIASTLGGMPYGNLLAGVAHVFVLGLGVVAALNHLGVGAAVTTPVLLAVLAVAGGVAGGVLARPWQDRWSARPQPPVIAEQHSREAPGRVPPAQAAIERRASRKGNKTDSMTP